MQLGELQSQIDRFTRRNVAVVALSVDLPAESKAMRDRLGITFTLGSDANQSVVKAFRVQNPDTNELALHAVYIFDEKGEIFYRKVASRRPGSNELIDAIDAWRGQYPQHDFVDTPDAGINVAFPTNNFQALIEMAAAGQLPQNISRVDLEPVFKLLRERETDDALITYRNLMRHYSSTVSQADLYRTSAWVTRQLFIADNAEAIKLGSQLSKQLTRVRELQTHSEAPASAGATDLALVQARARLARLRARVSEHAQAWRLRSAKTTLRSYREVARAAVAAR